MVSSRHEGRQSVPHRSAAPTEIPGLTGLPSASSSQAPPTTDAAPSLNMKAASGRFTGIEHRPKGELSSPRSQPYTVWCEGKIVYFCRTKMEAAHALGLELKQAGLRAAVVQGAALLTRQSEPT